MVGVLCDSAGRLPSGVAGVVNGGDEAGKQGLLDREE
jgi:hypothetical protein